MQLTVIKWLCRTSAKKRAKQYQYLYCTSQLHALTGLYAVGSTCANKSGQGYATSYDAFGNVSSCTYNNTTATLSYDTLDHFVEWNAGASSQEWHLYDAGGQRVLRRSTNGSNTTMTVYPFGLEEHLYSGSGTNQGNTYYHTLAGKLLGTSDGASTIFYQTDLQVSVVADWSNTVGSAALRGNQVYGPYGQQRYTQGTAKGFTGQYNDSVSGLDYYNVRSYDPVVDLFLSSDTLQGNGAGMDPCSYVDGNPETLTDPSGQYIVGEGGQIYHPGSPFYIQGERPMRSTPGSSITAMALPMAGGLDMGPMQLLIYPFICPLDQLLLLLKLGQFLGSPFYLARN